MVFIIAKPPYITSVFNFAGTLKREMHVDFLNMFCFIFGGTTNTTFKERSQEFKVGRAFGLDQNFVCSYFMAKQLSSVFLITQENKMTKESQCIRRYKRKKIYFKDSSINLGYPPKSSSIKKAARLNGYL